MRQPRDGRRPTVRATRRFWPKRTGAKVFRARCLIQTMNRPRLGQRRAGHSLRQGRHGDAARPRSRSHKCGPSIVGSHAGRPDDQEDAHVPPAVSRPASSSKPRTGSSSITWATPGSSATMRLIGEYYKPDVVLIPIGGHFVMDPRDAAYATRKMLKPKHAVPVQLRHVSGAEGHPPGVSELPSGRRRRTSTRSARRQADVLAGAGRLRDAGRSRARSPS